MGYTRKIFHIVIKAIAALFLIALLGFFVTSVSPIYDFPKAKPFCGPDIYNPYRSIDSGQVWKRANFHTHTRVKGIMNECEKWPGEVLKEYNKYGYDILTFSNHNELTSHPYNHQLQVNVYEHGYNLFKYHKLVFGSSEVRHFDHLLPFLASQKQFQIELLSKDSDLIQLNHPLRTHTLSKSQMEKLSGYQLIELDSGMSTENEYWDWALSAGRYSFALANDDLHYPDQSDKIAVRCNFLSTKSAKYEDILNTLKDGAFYCMRIPDYGNGDLQLKQQGNSTIPYILDIGVQDSTIFLQLSEPAERIMVTGQNHTNLATFVNCDNMRFALKHNEPYARITAYFSDGEVIYTNPFARYDSSVSESPFTTAKPQINIILTILYNLLLLCLCIGDGYLFYKYILKR